MPFAIDERISRSLSTSMACSRDSSRSRIFWNRFSVIFPTSMKWRNDPTYDAVPTAHISSKARFRSENSIAILTGTFRTTKRRRSRGSSSTRRVPFPKLGSASRSSVISSKSCVAKEIRLPRCGSSRLRTFRRKLMLLPNLRWRERRQRERVNAVGAQLLRKCRINAALALDARQSFEDVGDYSHIEVRLASRPCTGVTCVPGAVILDHKFPRSESGGQFLADRLGDRHATSVSCLRPRKSSNTFSLFFHASTP